MRYPNKKIVEERIEILFNEAEKNQDYADRYVFLARKLSMRYNYKIPKKYKINFCKKCYKYLSSSNCVVRTDPKTKTLNKICLNCKHINRTGYRK